tara:strand:- start:230 stop:871 length:642 start_codon:yes stop_codon:yes gene_type:complete
MKKGEMPILYSFRRCPYAIRARLALIAAQQTVELREIVLKDKPEEFLNASPSKTVPCLVLKDEVIDESIDIMIWALQTKDPKNWLKMPDNGYEIIEMIDNKFKDLLDKTKYSTRYANEDLAENRKCAVNILINLEESMRGKYLFSDEPTLCDVAIFPFVRQFAFIDKAFFDNLGWRKLGVWLDSFINSTLFIECQHKFKQWHPADLEVHFPLK